jgi:hypothetical protein
VKAGIVDPRRLVFAEEHVARVEQVAPARADALGRAASAGFARLYRSQPLQEGPDLAARLLTLLDDPGLLGPPPRPLGE